MLDANRLKATIKQAYIDVDAAGLNAGDGLDLFCEKLATAIVNEIKQAKVNYTAGLAAPNGAVTGTFNHTVQ